MSSVEIILTEPVDRLGAIGDVVSVKRGYFRNMLRPRGMALQATAANLADFQVRKSDLLQRSAEAKSRAMGLCEQIQDKNFILVRQASNMGVLYGSVTARDVVEVVSKSGAQIFTEQVVVSDRIKTLGMHRISLRLFAEVVAPITLVISRSETEAEALIAAEKAEAEAAEQAKNQPQYQSRAKNKSDTAEAAEAETPAEAKTDDAAADDSASTDSTNDDLASGNPDTSDQ